MNNQDRVDFVLITPLSEERDALLSLLHNPERINPSHADSRVYYRSQLPFTFPNGTSSTYSLVLCPLIAMGRVESANATGDAIRLWNPRYVVLVGIAGGCEKSGVRVGDVIVATQFADYEEQRLGTDSTSIRWRVYPADTRLLNQAMNHDTRRWQQQQGATRPTSTLPMVHFGVVCTGDKVIANGLLDQFHRSWDKLVGVEMEAGGCASAVQSSASKPGFFMVRGVSDLADSDKGQDGAEATKRYACELAASYTISLLESGPVPTENSIAEEPWQSGSSPTSNPEHASKHRVQAEPHHAKQLDPIEYFQKQQLEKKQAAYSSQLQEGQILGKQFLLSKCVGSGGIGSVWKCFDRQLRRFAAVKVLHRYLGSHQTIERFYRGARKMALLDHPCIVKVFAEHNAPNLHYFVMEYVEGPNLEEAVVNGLISADEAISCVLQVGDALQYAHNLQIIHRDLKPANILFDIETRKPKLTDFDLVKASDTEGYTQTGPMGTWLYSAPESKITGREADERADIYSLAMTMVFALHGGLSLDAARDPQAFLADVSCSAAIRSVLERAVEDEPSDRYQTVALFLTDFRKAMQEDELEKPNLAKSLTRLRKNELVKLAVTISRLTQKLAYQFDDLSAEIAKILRNTAACTVALGPNARELKVYNEAGCKPASWNDDIAEDVLQNAKWRLVDVPQSGDDSLVTLCQDGYFPIWHREDGRVWGILYLQFCRPFIDSDIVICEFLASSLALAFMREGRELGEQSFSRIEQLLSRMSVPADPKAFSSNDWAFAYHAKPADGFGVSADIFRISIAPNGNPVVLFADVVGKGPSSVITPVVSAIFELLVKNGQSITCVAESLNVQVASYGFDMFVTALLIEIDLSAKLLKLVNAGHIPPVLIRGEVIEQEWGARESGVPLGIVDDYTYELVARPLEEVDKFFIYTDGLTDASDAEGRFLGTEQVIKHLMSLNARSCAEIVDGIARMRDRYANGRYDDDTTFALFQLKR